MKVILAILCGLMMLFSGGCALLAIGGNGYSGGVLSDPITLIPAAIAVLNGLVLLALFKTRKQHVWAFYTLAALDVAAIAIIALMWSGFGLKDDGINLIGAVLIGGLGLKAVLTFIAARKGWGAGEGHPPGVA